MRYDTPVYFQKITPGEYDPDTGDTAEDIIEEIERFASVYSTGAEMLNLVYGQIRQDSLTIQLQTQYKTPFDRIRIGDTVYKVDTVQNLRVKQYFVVSEVQ